MSVQSVGGNESAYLKANPAEKAELKKIADADGNGQIEGTEKVVYDAMTSTLDKKDDIMWTQFKVGGITTYLPHIKTIKQSDYGEYTFTFKTGVVVKCKEQPEMVQEANPNDSSAPKIFSHEIENFVYTGVNGIKKGSGVKITGCDKDERITVSNSTINDIDGKGGHNTVRLDGCKGEYGLATKIQTDAIEYLNSQGFHAYSKHAPGVLDINQSIVNNYTSLLDKIERGKADDYEAARLLNPYAVTSPHKMRAEIQKYKNHGCTRYEITGQKPDKTGFLKGIFG